MPSFFVCAIENASYFCTPFEKEDTPWRLNLDYSFRLLFVAANWKHAYKAIN
jgi:hypothetical protein